VSMLPVRIAFQDEAAGALRLDHAGLSYQDNRQVLSFTGWHADGTPFALVTAAFAGSPVDRAKQAARDIVASHGTQSASLSLGRAGVAGSAAVASNRAEPPPIQALRSKIMSQKGSGLARLVNTITSRDGAADQLASRLETALSGLDAEMATTTQIVGNIEKSVADLRAVNALYSNGAPALPTPPGSSSTSGA